MRISQRVLAAALSPREALDLAQDIVHLAAVIAQGMNELTGVEQRVAAAGAAADVARKVADAVPASWSQNGQRAKDEYVSPELMLRARDLASSSFQPMEVFLLAAAIYLVMSLPISFVARRLEARLARGR